MEQIENNKEVFNFINPKQNDFITNMSNSELINLRILTTIE